jgi:hypothetical protein
VDNRGYLERIGSYIVPKGTFALVGGLAGGIAGGTAGMAGGPLSAVGLGLKGAAVGSSLGARLSKAVGFGDYVINSNTLLGSDNVPEVRNTNAGMIVRHREFIGDIAPSIDFQSQTFSINPGISSSFPWLAQIATAFEEYKLRGMIYEFKTMSSDSILSAGASTALGSVIMATQYNAINPPFIDKKSMENYQFASSTKPSESLMHPIECAHEMTAVDHHYVRSTPSLLSTGGDKRLYDIGNFQIATVGMQNTTGTIGELWVTYEIEFLKPKYFNYALEDHYFLNGITNAAPFGTTSGVLTASLLQTNAIGGVLNGTGNAYSWPKTISSGKFMIVHVVSGTAAALVAPTITYQNCVPINSIAQNTIPSANNTGTSDDVWVYTLTVRITGSDAGITFTGATLPSAPIYGDLYVIGLSDSVK